MITLSRLRTTRLSPILRITNAIQQRPFMKQREDTSPLPPNFSMDAIRPPPSGLPPAPEPDVDPMAYHRNPVTSAHIVDVTGSKLSNLDSAAFSPDGSVRHGRIELNEKCKALAGSIPLEYLALLHPASEGVAALRQVGLDTDGVSKTVLVYGATRPAGLTVTQLASAAGHAVIAVVDGQHSGHDEMVDTVKGLTMEPGTAVPEEYAVYKGTFRELVDATVGSDTSKDSGGDTAGYIEEFKSNLAEYTQTYPSDLPAAVSTEHLKFSGKEKDRANFRINMDTYLSQFPRGADAIDDQLLNSLDGQTYQRFKDRFGIQTTAIISGGDGVTNIEEFSPSAVLEEMLVTKEEKENVVTPYEFSVSSKPEEKPVSRPIGAAIINVTPELSAACELLSKQDTLRGKAEALAYLTEGQRNAHAAASAVAALAAKAKAPVITVGGSLPNMVKCEEPTANDVEGALSAMALDGDGEAKLNYFIQVYRASDWEVYEEYGVMRAKEPCSGPRTIVVTK